MPSKIQGYPLQPASIHRQQEVNDFEWRHFTSTGS